MWADVSRACYARRQNHTLKDDWTVVTDDMSLCAQFEHTLLITDDGVDVLTAYSPFADVPEEA